jgi:hypothetical protein
MELDNCEEQHSNIPDEQNIGSSEEQHSNVPSGQNIGRNQMLN